MFKRMTSWTITYRYCTQDFDDDFCDNFYEDFVEDFDDDFDEDFDEDFDDRDDMDINQIARFRGRHPPVNVKMRRI